MTFELLVLALRVVIVLVLLLSGIAKLFDREGSAEAMIGFGVPTRLVALAAAALPWLEIALAIGMIFSPTLTIAAAGATLLFAVFTFGVTRVTLHGENIDCHCFGQLSSGPITWTTVMRNVGLTLAAIIVMWWSVARGSQHLWEPMTWEAMVAGLIAAVIAVMGWAILSLWRNQLELLERLEELQALIPAGRIAKPPIEESFARVTAEMTLTDVAGEIIPVSSLHTRNRPTLLVFVSSSCRSCNALLPEVAAWQTEFTGLMRIAIVGSGVGEQIFTRAEGAGVENVRFSTDGDLAATFNVKQFPTAVLVDHDGYVRNKPALGGVAIRRVIDELRTQAGGQ